MSKLVKISENVNVLLRGKEENEIEREQIIAAKNRGIAYGVHGGKGGHSRKNTCGVHYGSKRGISGRMKTDKIDVTHSSYKSYREGEISFRDMLRAQKKFWLL